MSTRESECGNFPASSPARSAPQAVLITGASGGIGRAISQAFGRAGWYVGVHYRQNKAAAEETLKLVIEGNGTGDLYQADVREGDSVQRMIDRFSHHLSAASALICNAGIGASSLILRQREETWDEMMATNLTGTFHCFRAIAPAFIERGGGSIIVIGSHAGFHGATGQAAYASSKAGLIGLTKSAAQEWGPLNIRVNLVLPGWHRTPLSDDAMPESEGCADHALQRPPSRHEVANTILHLAQLNEVSGQVWNCDSRNL